MKIGITIITLAAILSLTTPAHARAATEESLPDVVLPEINVDSRKRDVLYMTGYVREYTTLTAGNDTISLFREKAVDFMIPGKRTEKVIGWRRPRLLASRSYYRFVTSEGVDSVSNYYSQYFSWSDWIEIVTAATIPSGLRSVDVATDTVKGKYSPLEIWSRDGDTLRLKINALADKAGQKWMPGIFAYMNTRDVEPDRFKVVYTFVGAGNHEILADNIVSISTDIETIGRGKMLFEVFPKDVSYYVDSHTELYITDRRYLTASEARKRANRLPNDPDIKAPDKLPPPDREVLAIIDRVNGIDHERLHLNVKGDDRLVSKHYGKKHIGPIGKSIELLKSIFRRM